MKNILVPISFSATSRNALVRASYLATKYNASLHLLHCYPKQEYNRKYNFEEEDYDIGIRRMLIKFYNDCLENTGKHKFKIITAADSVSNTIAQISPEFDLLVLSRTVGYEGIKNNFFGDKIFYISTKALCPVLILPLNQKEFLFEEAKNIWHFQRNETEKDVINNEISHFGITPTLITTKSLTQKHFVSKFWEDIVGYAKTHDKDFLKTINESFDEEKIDLLILVNRMKGQFSIFLKDEAFQIISQFDVPILIFQDK